MNLKYVLASALIGGLLSFIWGAVYHAAIGIDMKVMHEFKDGHAVAVAVRDNTAGNGMYVSHQGIIAAVRMTPDLADRSKMGMGAQLVKQYLINAVVAGLLAWLLIRVPIRSVMCAAGFFALVGLAGGLNQELSAWNWYSHPLDFALAMIFDQVACFFVAGLAVGWLKRKMVPVAAP